ncbi:hypothetical protein SESBI_48215 [Sesbania bispinosa]|nr:hypothetical protein SESBI_48215 [Sesbania bispinosa]
MLPEYSFVTLHITTELFLRQGSIITDTDTGITPASFSFVVFVSVRGSNVLDEKNVSHYFYHVGGVIKRVFNKRLMMEEWDNKAGIFRT